MYYIPPAFFFVWAMYAVWRFPSLRNPSVLTDPKNPPWGFWQFFSDSTWTDFGRQVRSRWIRHALIGAVIALALFPILRAFGFE